MVAAALRAFVFIGHGERIEMSVHRDLSTVLSAWRDALSQDPMSAMLLHVGFDRPETDSVAPLLKRWSQRVLLSESTRWSLPADFETAQTSVGALPMVGRNRPLQVYLGLTGWGYLVAYEPESSTLSPRRDLEPWLTALSQETSALYDSLQALAIETDRDYLEQRTQLPVAIRDEIDDFRFAQLLGSVDEHDPFALLRIAPDWLLQLPISSFDDLPVRTRNAFLRAGIEVVGQIGRLTQERMFAIDNFGKKSYETIAPALLVAASSKPYQHLIYSRSYDGEQHSEDPADTAHSVSVTAEPVRYRTLWFGVQAALNQMAPRNRIVLEARLGRHEPPRTLEVLGAMLHVSRERARQLEAKGFEEFSDRSWATELTRHLQSRFMGRSEPLFLDLLAAEDDWFSGFDDCLGFLGCLVQRLHEGEYWAWSLNGRLILARLSDADWDVLERNTRSSLAAQRGAGLTRSDVSLFIEAAASTAGGPELAGALAAALRDSLHFGRNPESGVDVLVGVGRSVRAAVAAIMAEADEPIDLRTIARRCAERIGEIPSELAIRGALSAIAAYPFRGRRYAVERHLRLSEADVAEILAALERILIEGPMGKQWHCTELLADLREERPDLPASVDQYVLNIVLHRSTQANDLGRFVWVAKGSGSLTTKDRLDLADLTILFLERAGHPLSTAELRTAISGVRGLNSIYQVFPNDRVARLDAGRWGLVDRDFEVTADERRKIFERIEHVLNVRNKACTSQSFAARS